MKYFQSQRLGVNNRISIDQTSMAEPLNFVALLQALKEKNVVLTTLSEDLFQIKNEIEYSIKYCNEIPSKYSYIGHIPALKWEHACADSSYSMKWSIDNFIETLRDASSDFRKTIAERSLCFVSLGAGTGQKDAFILSLLFRNKKIFYVPIDISREMLSIAKRAIQISDVDILLSPNDDFESEEALSKMIYCIGSLTLNQKSGKGMLYSLLGNTLSNLRDPLSFLKTLSGLMKKK